MYVLKSGYYILVLLFIFTINCTGISAKEFNLNGKIVFSSYEGFEIIYLGQEETWQNPETIDPDAPIAQPEWLHDGESVICEFYDKKNLAIFNLKTLKLTKLSKPSSNMLPDNYDISFEKPQISPNGLYLGTYIFEKYGGYRLAVYNLKDESLNICSDHYAKHSKFSWSEDSKCIAFRTDKHEIAIYNIENNRTRILSKGYYPTIHPIRSEIYYVGLDNKFYVISMHGGKSKIISKGDWGWIYPIGFSRNGRYFYFTDGASSLFVEKKAIFLYDLETHDKKRISKKYSILGGASLFED